MRGIRLQKASLSIVKLSIVKSPFRSTLKLYVLPELCPLKDDKADTGAIQH